MKHRVPPILAAALTGLALSAAPAMAGSDGCSGASCQDEEAPAQVVPAVPAPVGPAPLLSQRSADGETTKRRARRNRPHRREVVFTQRTAPQGAVAAGEGGTADGSDTGALLGLAGALVFGGAAAYAIRRRLSS